MRKITKIKKSLLCALSCLLLFCIGLCFVGCRNRKYDVTIKIKNNFGQEWIFTPDIKELTYEFKYTGRDMTFYIDSFRLAEHPDWGNKWFEPSGEGANVFDMGILYGDGEQWLYEVDNICERGSYSISIIADSTSDLWNYRSVRLYIIVS